MKEAEKDAAGERPAPPLPKQRRACLLLPEDDPAVFSFVAAAAEQIGITMKTQEELAPGVFYPAAQKLFVRVSHISLFGSDTFSNIFHSLLFLPIICSIWSRYLFLAGVQDHVRVSHPKEPPGGLSPQRWRSTEGRGIGSGRLCSHRIRARSTTKVKAN